MSQENVELVRAMWATFMEGGFPADAFSDEVECRGCWRTGGRTSSSPGFK
jgi:hypothetical protein